MSSKKWRGIVLLALLALSVPASAHHAMQAEFDQNNVVVIAGVLKKINWVNPHVNFLLDVKEPDGALTTWTLVHAGPNQMRAAGLSDRDFCQLGKTYTAILALARNGSPRGRSGCRTANPISAGAGATAAATSAAMLRRGTGSTRRATTRTFATTGRQPRQPRA